MIWNIQDPSEIIVESFMDEFKITQFQAKLLVNRNIKTVEEARKFLLGDISDLYDSSLMLDIDLAAQIIADAVVKGELITVFGDYDTDGITSIALSIRALEKVGANVNYYLPHRINEGYGMNKEAIKLLHEKGTKLIITVDNGISAIEEVKLAKELGMNIVVTDHHDCQPTLPAADAIVNMKRPGDPYPNKKLCGCAVIWRVLEKVYYLLPNADVDYLYDLLPIVSIGIIQDMMDLVDENRIIVKEGLAIANHKAIPGIAALMEIYEISELKASDVAFKLGPALNADGRLYTADTAIELMLTEDKDLAQQHAAKLKEINDERKALTKFHLEETERLIKEKGFENNPFMLVLNKEIPEGIVGLIASKIKEKYQVPTFIFTESEEYFKCSGRGVDKHPFDIFTAIMSTKEYWEKGGGHGMACGLSVKKDEDHLEAFSKRLNELTLESLNGEKFIPQLMIDAEINYPTEDIVSEIEILEPTGKGNPAARLSTGLLDIIEAKPVGDKTHLRLKFTQMVNGEEKDIIGIAFGMTYLYQKFGAPGQLKVVYEPSINEYTSARGITYRNVQLQIQDMDAAAFSQVPLISSLKSKTT